MELEGRIFEGEEAETGQRPFQVALTFNDNICGGSIYNSDTIITAAHCVLNYKGPKPFKLVDGIFDGDYMVRAGVFNLAEEESSEQLFKPVKAVPHPMFQRNFVAGHHVPYDIAIIKLDGDIEYNEFAQPIQPADPAFNLTGSNA